MGRKSQFSGEELAYLKPQAAAYRLVKGTQETTGFWDPFWAGWRREFPSRPLEVIVGETGNKENKKPLTLEGVSDEQKKEGKKNSLQFEQRIKHWITNNTRDVGPQGSNKVLDLSGRKVGGWHDYQAYTKLYWPKHSTKVNAEYQAYKKTPLPDGQTKYEAMVAFRNRRMKELLAEETLEVKAEVKKLMDGRAPTEAERKGLERLLEEGIPEETAQEVLRTQYVSHGYSRSLLTM
jgi:hypothetical protein